jgi:uncharacterized protein
VNDHAGVLDDSSRARLESFLDQRKRKTGVQFAVLVLRTTAPLDPVEYKTEAYRRWVQGNRNSLLLLVALQERRAHFETGYELEGVLPDGLEARILRREVFPRFREGDYAGGIRQGVLKTSAIIARDRGVTLEWDGSELRYREDGDDRIPPLALAVLAFLVLLVVFSVVAARPPGYGRGRRRHGGWWSSSGTGGWGGGWGGSGGWGGGGGGGGFGGFGGGGGFGSGGGGGGGGW